MAQHRLPSALRKLAYPIPEFCGATGFSRSKVYKLMRTGELPYCVVGDRRVIYWETAEKFFKSRERTAA